MRTRQVGQDNCRLWIERMDYGEESRFCSGQTCQVRICHCGGSGRCRLDRSRLAQVFGAGVKILGLDAGTRCCQFDVAIEG